MKKAPVFAAIMAAFAIAALFPTVCPAQYYRSTPRYYGPPLRSDIPRAPRIPGRITPWSISVAPSPELLRKWERHRRWLDFQQMIRSPQNPESTIDYMFRTF
jgi:hypothetical protein